MFIVLSIVEYNILFLVCFTVILALMIDGRRYYIVMYIIYFTVSYVCGILYSEIN